jgi:hypothetical protein
VRRFRAALVALAIAWGSSPACSVFPDQAVLPTRDDPGGDAGILIAGGSTGSSSAGASGVQDVGGEAGSLAASGGESGGAASSGASGGLALAGSSGAGGAANCKSMHAVLMPSGDAWIDAAEPQVNHGADTQLFVLGGASEQRALFTFTVPKTKAGDVFVSATLVLTLGQKPNLGAASRVLAVYALIVGFNEKQVTWSNHGNGAAKRWATPGGDLSANFGTGTLQAGAISLRLDASALVEPIYSSQKTELDLLVRDAEPAPADPINFAFVAKDGSADTSPLLDIEYCRP